MIFHEYDVVRLRRSVPEHNLERGAIGAIVMVYDNPRAYEVELCDADGVTIALLTLGEEELEKVTR